MSQEPSVGLLYVEDEPEARELLEKLIRHKFPEVTLHVAADGAQGMALYAEHHPHVILTDIMMPVLDGLEMTKGIRRMNPDAYVIALTAYNDAEWEARCKEHEFNLCLTKPVVFAKLLQALGEAIQHIKSNLLKPGS